MSTIRYTSSLETITHMISDGANAVWIAYEKDSLGVIHLQKVRDTSLDQILFDISITDANAIVAMVLSSTYIYILFDNASDFVARGYQLSAPSFNIVDFPRQTTLEEPVSIAYWPFFEYVIILYPGNSSATNAITYHYDTVGNFQESVAIRVANIHIVDARSIVADDNDEMWIVTHTNPVKLVRMFFESEAIWKFAFTNIN